MQDLWSRLEAWAKKNAKRSLHLRAGASEKAIAAAEKKLKLKFPADFRASLLAHDGQEHEDDVFPWMPGCEPLATLDAIVERWTEEQDQVNEDDDPEPYDAKINNVMAHPRRIPIAGSKFWDGDNTYLDLFPAKKGKEGQLLGFTSECDMEVVAESFRSALEHYVSALESGEWVFRDGEVEPKKPSKDPGHPTEEFAKYVRKRAKAQAASQ